MAPSLAALAAQDPRAILVAVFFLDALGLPTLPEVTALLVFSVSPSISWGAEMLAFIVATELVAGLLLFLAVRSLGAPRGLLRLAERYSRSLLFTDERLLLLNRVVPVLPFGAAFIHLRKWRPVRAFAFIAAGSLVKYAALLAFSSVAYAYFDSTRARIVSLVGLAVFLVASWIVLAREKRRGHTRAWTAQRESTDE